VAALSGGLGQIAIFYDPSGICSNPGIVTSLAFSAARRRICMLFIPFGHLTEACDAGLSAFCNGLEFW